jgi:acyl-CoA synthetase (AMP-forming)/AMP-acid ligase II
MRTRLSSDATHCGESFTFGTRRYLAQKALAAGAIIGLSSVHRENPFISALCRRLDEAGVGSGMVVALANLSAAETLLATVAIWSADAVPFPLPPDKPAPFCNFIVSAGPHVELANGMPDYRGLEHAAVLHQTSGSTASPKVARRSVNSVLTEAAGYHRGLELGPSDVVRIPVPVTHSFGWGIAISAMLCGCRVLPQLVRLPSILAAEVDAGEISKLALTPPLARLLTETRLAGSPRLLAAIVGAGTVSEDLVHCFHKRFGVRVTIGYGSTETGGTFIGSSGIGRPIDLIEITNPAQGEKGELVLRLPSPALGYVGEAPPSTCEWRTGDLVDRSGGHQVRYIARMSGSLRVNSQFVETEPYKAVLAGLSDVKDVVFLVLPGAEFPEIEELCVAVASRTLSVQQVTDALLSFVDRSLACRVFVFEQLPKNELGKLDRSELIRLIRPRQP